jgi:hypothetical protein
MDDIGLGELPSKGRGDASRNDLTVLANVSRFAQIVSERAILLVGHDCFFNGRFLNRLE